jgi:hypothetical protein
MALKQAYVGKWRIDDHMDDWDQDFIDLVVPGHFAIRKDGTGFFQFGAVVGKLHCRIEDRRCPGLARGALPCRSGRRLSDLVRL